MLTGELLEQMGYDVCAIESTEADAVAAAVRCRPDLVIVDVLLGDGSGVSAVEEILRAGPVHISSSAVTSRIFERSGRGPSLFRNLIAYPTSRRPFSERSAP